MPGLSFLSKKSWHVKNMDNQERVWLAEQAKAAEDSKTRELAQQIQQEREAEELARIAGKKSGGDRGTSWMYEGGTAAAKEREAEREAEEYLLGKEYNPQAGAGIKVKAAGDFDALASGAGVDQVVGSASAAPAVQERDYTAAAAEAASNATAESNPVADRNEEFHRRYEDPMYMVSQRKKERDTDAQKKKALFEKVMGGIAVPRPSKRNADDDADADDDNNGRDRRKKKRKKKSSSSRRRSRSRSGSRDRSRSHSIGRSRSGSRDRSSRKSSRKHKRDRRREKRHRHHSDYRRRKHSDDDEDRRHRRRRSRSRSRSRSTSLDRSKRYRDRSSRSRSRDDYHRGRRSRSRSRDRHDRRGGPRRSYSRSKSRSRSRSHSQSPPIRNDEEISKSAAAAKPAGFGLQGGSGRTGTSGGGGGGGIGPDAAMLAKKRQEKDMAKERYHSGRNRQRRHMSAEEREEVLKSMQSTASAIDAARSAKIASASKRSADKEGDDNCAGHHAGRGEASFLRDLSTKVHGIEDGASMAERIGRNRHTNQRGSESFL